MPLIPKIPDAAEIAQKIAAAVRSQLTEMWWAGASAGFGYGLIIGVCAGLAIAAIILRFTGRDNEPLL